MTNELLISCLTDKCDIYFEGLLISKEQIIKNYVDFFTNSFLREEHSVSIALHTGSICFEITSIILAALVCLYLDDYHNNDILDQLEIGELVLFGEEKQERYVWQGFADKDCNPVADFYSKSNNKHYAVLDQPTKSSRKYTTSFNLITPYNGEAQITDGRGLKKRDTNRNDFISYLFGVSPAEVPSINGISVVIVIERKMFDRILRGVHIKYNDGKRITLLNLVTASYYADSGEEYRYPGNAAQNEPILKAARKMSTAREIALDKRGNRAVGLLVSEPMSIVNGSSELKDLLSRKFLRFIHINAKIDSADVLPVIETQGDVDIFACTKEYLLQNPMQMQKKNNLTVELYRQIKNIIENTISVITVDGGCPWEDFKTIREVLYIIRKSDWDDYSKEQFVLNSYSLLNLFTTAVFSIGVLETATAGTLNLTVSSPSIKIRELRDLVENSGAVEEQCLYILDMLKRLYYASYSVCSKHDVLIQRLNKTIARKIAVVVPKAYYIDILKAEKSIIHRNVDFVTANRFDSSVSYDEIIIVGDFGGNRFEPLKCRTASKITVLLYECETYWFEYKKKNAAAIEKKLNAKLGLIEDELFEDEPVYLDDNNEIVAFGEKIIDLDQYIGKINTFDIEKYVTRVSGLTENMLTAEAYAIGRFVSGEQIVFSKYYNAVVYNPATGTVKERDAEDLSTGDMIVFARRDDNTRNMVDFIYENLLISGHFNSDILEATEKAGYWKEVLRNYKEVHQLSYRDISKRLKQLGSSLHEVAIRQWLIDGSHIVGPRDVKTMKQIAELTQDACLLTDTERYFEACRIVRNQRKKILTIIGKVIADKLSGRVHGEGSVFEVIYNNVENLANIMELESISLLDKPVTVPISIINKPIAEGESEV